jgi:hypothetical protein
MSASAHRSGWIVVGCLLAAVLASVPATTTASLVRLGDFCGYNHGVPALTSDGRLVAFSAQEENRCWIYVRDLRSGTQERLPGSRGVSLVERIAISDNGRYVAFLSQRNPVRRPHGEQLMRTFVWDRVRGHISGLPGRLGRASTEGMSMSPNGARVAFTARRRDNTSSDIWVWNRRRNKYRRAPRIVRVNGRRVHTGYSAKPELSGDGRRVSFLWFPSGSGLRCASAAVWDLPANRVRVVPGYEGEAGGQRRCSPSGGNSVNDRDAPGLDQHGAIAAFDHPVFERVVAVDLASGVEHVLKLRARIAGFQPFGEPGNVAVSSTTTTATFTVQEGVAGGLAGLQGLVRWNWSTDSLERIDFADPDTAPASRYIHASEDARTVSYLAGRSRTGYVWIDD